jgi:uncharacterized protein YjbI with pentapeptide repeats
VDYHPIIVSQPEHVSLLACGVAAWNQWRAENRTVEPDLEGLDCSHLSLEGFDLDGANLSFARLQFARANNAILRGANLERVDLQGASLKHARLEGAILEEANLSGADLTGAALTDAELGGADLTFARLVNANLARANLIRANLSNARLSEASLNEALLEDALLYESDLHATDLSDSRFGWTQLTNVDLRTTKGLDRTRHSGPSSIGIDTIYRSEGEIPAQFLVGAGVPDTLVLYVRSITSKPIHFYSCFISYSTRDQEFAERLHSDLQANGVRCWFAHHDMQRGKKIHEQIDEAIRVHERLLLILSRASMESDWVKTEIAAARKRERTEKRRVLFPVRLVDIDTLRDWECFDADAGRDSAREIREYFIPDFSC